MRKIPLATIFALLVILTIAGLASASVITLAERERGDVVELIQYDDETGQISVYRDGVLTEKRAATEREVAAVARITDSSARGEAVAELKASIADLKGRPLVNINDRLDRIEAVVIELAAQIGVE